MEENEDRISVLPCVLIEHILSYLPTKNAVATSVLSTKWKYLWTSITNLDFNDREVGRSLKIICCQTKIMRKRMRKERFINFVNRVLMCNVSDLQKFSLSCTRNYDYDVSHLHAWISTVLSRNVRELHISYSLIANNGLPRELYTCTSLVFLELSGGIVVNFPTLGCLPSLKILHIYSIQFVDDDSIYRLFSSCPLLEELFITGNSWQCDISVFNISAPALKKLRYRHFSAGYKYLVHNLVLNTPNLQDLEYSYNVDKGYPVNAFALHALVPGRSVEVLAAEFLQAISKVQRLSLFGDSMKIFQSCRVTLPKFEHLTHLDLAVSHGVEWKFVRYFLESLPQLECLDISGIYQYSCWLPPPKFEYLSYLVLSACYHVGWKFVMDFLDSSPQLETLIFRGIIYNEDEDEFYYEDENGAKRCWYPPQNVPSCLLFHLQKIEIKLFQWESDDLEMVKYFLKNSVALEKLIILSYPYDREICKKFLMLPRCSKMCQVEVSSSCVTLLEEFLGSTFAIFGGSCLA